MYKKFFHLKISPFAITPDVRFLFPSRRHQEALAHLQYSIQGNSGFVLLTGEVGTGKTTLSRILIERLPATVDIALIFNPKLSAKELITSICDELEIPYPNNANLQKLLSLLNNRLLESYGKGRTTILLLDEAQSLGFELLEQIRLLSNLETGNKKLLQIILIGQPELAAMLERKELRQFSQRITARYHITPLNKTETIDYVRYRLTIAGRPDQIFSPSALPLVHKLANGIPRLINKICDRALLGAYTLEERIVSKKIVRQAASEVLDRSQQTNSFWLPLAVALFFLALGGQLWLYSPQITEHAHKQIAHLGQLLPSSIIRPVVDDKQSPALKPLVSITTASKPSPAQLADSQNRTEAIATNKPATEILSQTIASQEPITKQKILAAKSSAQQIVKQEKPAILSKKTTPKQLLPLIQPALNNPVTMQTIFTNPMYPTRFVVALNNLLNIWTPKQQTPTKNASCQIVLRQQLRCVFLTGNWNSLRMLGMPFIIKLRSPGNKTHHILINSIGDQSVNFVFGELEVAMPIKDISPHWYGDFTVLMRTTPAGKAIISPKSTGKDVLWLRKRIQTISGVGTKTGDGTFVADYFDDELKKQVQKFQLNQHLSSDGVAGIMTLIKLDMTKPTTDRNIPRLLPYPVNRRR